MRYHHQCSSRRRQQATSFMQTCSHSDDSSPSFSYDGLISGTLDSHRLAAWAQPQGKENELVEEVYVCRRIIIIQRCSRRPAVPPTRRPFVRACVPCGLSTSLCWRLHSSSSSSSSSLLLSILLRGLAMHEPPLPSIILARTRVASALLVPALFFSFFYK